MKKGWIIILAVVIFAGPVISSWAVSNSEEAKGFVMKAISFLKANGKEKTLAEANNPKGQFIKGEVYVVVMDLNATMLAHPINQKIIGMNVIDVPDTDGKMFRREIIETAKTKGEGWVDYKYKNPTSNKVESKTSFIKRADDMIFVCGTYK